jgi:hypothetical protein
MADSKKSADAGQAEVQDAYQEAADRGYYGQVPDQPPNEAFSLASGPDSPSPLEQHIAINEARVADQKASPAEEVK